MPTRTWYSSWLHCFKGSVWDSNSNLRRTILGTSLQMMQQWTGVNFIFYYSTPFLQSTGAISDPFLTSMIFTIVNVCSTPISFYTVEKFGRQPLLIWGAFGMMICQFLVAIIGVTVGFNKTVVNEAGETVARNISAVNAQVAFIAIVFFFWGGLCTCAFVYAYFLVPETKGLSLEQVDELFAETPPRKSSKWRPTRPHTTEHERYSSRDGSSGEGVAVDPKEAKMGGDVAHIA